MSWTGLRNCRLCSEQSDNLECQDIAQVGPRLDAVKLATADERGGDGDPLGTVDAASVLPLEDFLLAVQRNVIRELSGSAHTCAASSCDGEINGGMQDNHGFSIDRCSVAAGSARDQVIT
jgi:hypothetical protein